MPADRCCVWPLTSASMQIFAGWVATLIVAGVTAGIIAALFVYSPSKLASDDRVYSERLLNRETLAMLNQLRSATSPLVSAVQLSVKPEP